VKNNGKKRSTTLQSTVAGRFKHQLSNLMKTLHSTESRFVRCVKSNTLLKPQIFNSNEVLRQLKYAGVMAALEMRRSGFPTRIDFKTFALRYHIMLGPEGLRTVRNLGGDVRSACNEVIQSRHVKPFIKHNMYRIGNTKIFLRADVLHLLDGIQGHVMSDAIVVVQSWLRGRNERGKYLTIKASLMLVQAVSRGHLARAHRRKEISKLQRHALMRRVGAGIARLNKYISACQDQSRSLQQPDSRNRILSKLEAIKALVNEAQLNHARAEHCKPRRDSEILAFRKGEARRLLEKAEVSLQKTDQLCQSLDQLMGDYFQKQQVFQQAKTTATTELQAMQHKYTVLKTSAMSLGKPLKLSGGHGGPGGHGGDSGGNSGGTALLPVRLRNDFNRVELSMERASIILGTNDASKYARTLTSVKNDLEELVGLYNVEKERLHTLNQNKTKTQDGLSQIDDRYRTCIGIVDAYGLWEIPSIQRLVDDYEQKKNRLDQVLHTSDTGEEFHRMLESVRSMQVALQQNVEENKAKVVQEKRQRNTANDSLKESQQQMRNLEVSVESNALTAVKSVTSVMRAARVRTMTVEQGEGEGKVAALIEHF
jgi:myosin heavy subunit